MYRRARTAGLTLVQLPIKLLDDPFVAPSYVHIRGAEVKKEKYIEIFKFLNF